MITMDTAVFAYFYVLVWIVLVEFFERISVANTINVITRLNLMGAYLNDVLIIIAAFMYLIIEHKPYNLGEILWLQVEIGLIRHILIPLFPT